MQSLTFLRGRRMWVVPNVVVEGTANDAEFFYLICEEIESTKRLGFGHCTVGDSAQDISFADMIDWRGNNLPENIVSPRILVSPRSQYSAFVVGNESNTGFRIARDPSAPGSVVVDLFIYEMGV
jgi:hypothetical protein